jgi:riboflavin kinase/FMN adenylyltransferase
MLHRLKNISDLPAQCRDGVVSIGNFDGVHRGHILLIESMLNLAREVGGTAVAFTFHPHPVSLLRPDQTPVPLTSLEHRSELLHSRGVDQVIAIRTDFDLLKLTADEFFERVIRRGLAARALVEGPNFGFGRDRSGTITTLNRLCAASNMRLEIVDPLTIDGQVVSSSRIRQCISTGQVELAAKLLGRAHRVRGQVGSGAGRGASLGFATANLHGIENLVPADGVYACRTEAVGQAWPVAAHIGANVTFGETHRSVEAHLIGFAGNLFGQILDLDFLARIRGTERFASADDLVRQMNRDVDKVCSLFVS